MWKETVKKWVFRCRLKVTPKGLIPEKTDWYILADKDYPWGDIEFHPAKEGGLTYTFPHQLYNAIGNENVPWRDGKICMRTPMRNSGHVAYDIEPFNVDERLHWLILRARGWLEAASEGRVAEEGEPFELPELPRLIFEMVGFVEDEESFRFWQEQPISFGVAKLVCPENINYWNVVSSFSNERDQIIRKCKFGVMLSKPSIIETSAMWIRIPEVPVIPPWQFPDTFGELRSVMAKQEIDFDNIFRSLAHRFRDRRRHILLVGFPIPNMVGGENHLYYWQGLRLPLLTHGGLKRSRPIEAGNAKNNIPNVINDDVKIDWITSRNWAENQIRTRGRASPQLENAKILLVGGGALGASIAELLIREGCKELKLVDGDIIDIGNLSRHTLSLQHICKRKATMLAEKLNDISPHATVQGLIQEFHKRTENEERQMAEYDIVIDCTGDDRVAYEMSIFPWKGNKLFVSASFGINAHRLFLFVSKSDSFPHAEFVRTVNPWLHKELSENEGLILTREGIGCWHPVFPARSDDIWLMGSVAAKCINEWAIKPPCSQILRVYEQNIKDGILTGINMVTES